MKVHIALQHQVNGMTRVIGAYTNAELAEKVKSACEASFHDENDSIEVVDIEVEGE